MLSLTSKHVRVTKLCEERQTLLKYTTDVSDDRRLPLRHASRAGQIADLRE